MTDEEYDALEYRLGCLASNLADAAWAQRGFLLGINALMHRDCDERCQYRWSPGCGKAAP